MALYVTVHARYKDVQWGLFDEDRLLVRASDESKKVSKQFIDLLHKMLKKKKLTLSDLSFIAVHQGPAPFTTLRVCLATVNGIGFATGLPLVGVNGLDALLDEHESPEKKIAVALLNAFSKDVYYAVSDPTTGIRSLGYAPADKFLKELKDQYTQPMTFLGNACPMYQEDIEQLFGAQATILDVDMVSLEKVAQEAHKHWKNKNIQDQIMPVYLKDYSL